MRKISLIAALVMALVFALAGCGKGTEAPAATETATESATATTEVPADIVLAGTQSIASTVEALQDMYTEKTPDVTFKRQYTSSNDSMAYLAAGKADIALMTRDLKDQEVATYAGLESVPLYTVGIAFVVNNDCPVKDLTADQIKQIFNAEITDWSELGADAGPITLYGLEGAMGPGDVFEQTVLGRNEAGDSVAIEDTKCTVYESYDDVAAAVADDAAGIGFLPIGVLSSYDVTALSVDGVAPSAQAITDGSYPYYRHYNLATIGDVSDKAKAFISYCTTDPDALAYITQQGYILP